MEHILYSTLISAAMLSFSAPAMAQIASEPAVTLQAQTAPQDFRQRRAQISRPATRNARNFVQSQHARLRCGRGETKHLIMAGKEDNFSSSGSEPATKSSRVASNPLGVNHGDNVSQHLINTGTWKNRYNGSGFTKVGTNFSADFSTMALRNGSNLQDYYRSSGDTILDLYVQDDHSVDYVAASVCAGSDKKA